MVSKMIGFVGGAALRTRPTAAAQALLRARSTRCSASAPHDGSGRPGITPSKVRARHILVESEEMIDSVVEQLNAGKGTFDSLASIVSTCPSKARGGDLGWFKRNVMVKPFEEAAFGNPPGAIVKVRTDFGWHLIQVEAHGLEPDTMTVQEFAERVKDGSIEEVQRIDCREKGEVETASLPGFLNLPMGEYGRWADEFDRGEVTLDKDKETVVMCHHGMRSANFCAFLSQQGFSNVRNLVGGIDAYAKQIDPSIPQY
jgi:rhodanese-related sulfurtransferase